MMDMNRMRKDVMKELEKMVPEGIELREADVVKMNDTRLCGISFSKGDIGSTVYLNDFPGRRSAHNIAEEMLAQFENPVNVPPWEAISKMKDKMSLKTMKDFLFVTLLEIKRNHEFLKNIPYKEIGYGLAYICRIRHEDRVGHGFSCVTITDDLLESNQWDINEMFDLAIENTLRIDGPKLTAMEDALFGEATDFLQSDQPIQMGSPIILTNHSGIFGASVLWLPGVIQKILNRIGEPVYAIPSSIHEYILIPQSSGVAIDTLNAMCREANQTVVQVSEVLSDTVIYLCLPDRSMN